MIWINFQICIYTSTLGGRGEGGRRRLYEQRNEGSVMGRETSMSAATRYATLKVCHACLSIVFVELT